MLPLNTKSPISLSPDTEQETQESTATSYLGSIFSCVKSLSSKIFSSAFAIGLLAAPALAATQDVRVKKPLESYTFRPYVASYMRPGEQVLSNGRAACTTIPIHHSQSECSRCISIVYNEIAQYTRVFYEKPENQHLFNDTHQLHIDPVSKAEINYLAPPEEAGVPVYRNFDNEMHIFRLRIDPKIYENHKRAIAFVEQTFFSGDKSPLEHDIDTTIAYILEVHRILLDGVGNPDQLRPGLYRSGSKCLDSEDSNTINQRASKVLNAEEKKIYAERTGVLATKSLSTFQSQQEHRMWEKLGMRFMPSSNQLPQEMKLFAVMLLEHFENGMDKIELAAYLHTHLGRINPFSIGTGKTARLLMNAILLRYTKVPSLIFPSKPKYVQATVKAINMADHKIFAAFLRDEIIPATKNVQAKLKELHADVHRLLHFESNAPLLLNPGLLFTPDGKYACQLKTDPTPMDACDVRAHTIENQDYHKRIIQELGGFGNNPFFGVEHNAIIFNINPKLLENFGKAYNAVEERVLKNPAAFVESADKTIADIKHFISLLDPIQNGSYRTDSKIVTLTDFVSDAKNKLTSDEFRQFAKSHEEIKGDAPRSFTYGELDLWKKAGAYITPDPADISTQMQLLATETQLLIERSDIVDFIYIAAHLHTGMLRIHPFMRSNGKLSRMLMNGILGRYMGIKPIIFPERKRYIQMSHKAVCGNAQEFAYFLQSEILPLQEKLYAYNT